MPILFVKIIILSILAVAMIGLMVPSVFAVNYTVENAIGSGTPGCEETNECYVPSNLTISPGDTVIFLNNEEDEEDSSEILEAEIVDASIDAPKSR